MSTIEGLKIRTEIEDLDTGCTYIREGSTLSECIRDFQNFFFKPHRYRVLWWKFFK